MKKTILFLVMLIPSLLQAAPKQEIMLMKTRWAADVTPENAWRSYPRPQLQRDLWQNLNGTWQYAITEMDTPKSEVRMEGDILVPFCVESQLSGVNRDFFPDDRLWYRKEFNLRPEFKGRQILLHFAGVDYESTIWLNGKQVGTHEGGFVPFTVDITRYVKWNGPQVLELSVTDPTDTKTTPRGKQSLRSLGMWYSSVSGIWKTVWIEGVDRIHIERLLPQTDIRKGTVKLNLTTTAKGNETVDVKVLKDGRTVAEKSMGVLSNEEILVPDHLLWTTESPELYRLEITLRRGSKVLDQVKSYFAFREVGVVKDECGYNRVALNGQPVFQLGTLDQGWWPDGKMTPPSEEAVAWEIKKLKALGYNTVRKHIKVEPEIFYYYADSLGLMVWQDMVAGLSFRTDAERRSQLVVPEIPDWNAPESHRKMWEKEQFAMMDLLKFYPCITTWTIFNEGWAQYDTKGMTEKVRAYDPTRLINSASGWADRNCGDFYDAHNYPTPSMKLPAMNGDRISFCGEFGGLWYVPVGRNWFNMKENGQAYKTYPELISKVVEVMDDLETLAAQGLSGAFFTQTADQEGEVNGIMTYDREVDKIPESILKALNEDVYKVKPKKAVTLIPDGLLGQKYPKQVEIQGVWSEQQCPLFIHEAFVRSSCEFNVDREYEYLSLWLSTPGQVKIRLNGELIYVGRSNGQPNYNQFNISEFSRLLKIGTNKFEIELVPLKWQVEKGYSLDYGLRAFN